MHFDDNRSHDPSLHCPPQYAQIAVAGIESVGAGWLRHEWRQLFGDSELLDEGTIAVGYYCIHCKEERLDD